MLRLSQKTFECLTRNRQTRSIKTHRIGIQHVGVQENKVQNDFELKKIILDQTKQIDLMNQRLIERQNYNKFLFGALVGFGMIETYLLLTK